MNERLRYNYADFLQSFDRRLFYDTAKSKSLTPCARIEDPDLLVGVFSASILKPARFRVRGARDRQPITLIDTTSGTVFQVTHPGKSAFIYFGQDPDKQILGDLVKQSLNRQATRDDHLHLATVGWIEESGWQAWWTPLPDSENWVHVRLIANRTIETGNDPQEEDLNALSQVFIKAL